MNLRLLRLVVSALIVGTLAACSTRPPAPVAPSVPSVQPPAAPTVPVPVPGTLTQSKSRWVPVGWGELPGFEGDAL
ncbi:transglycosylase, partial [Diaphorobacter sp. DS2]